MTYQKLEANIDVLRMGNEDILTPKDYSDENLQSLYKIDAKLEMKLDIEQALLIDSNEYETEINIVADKNEIVLSRALAFKQLSMFYKNNDGGLGTKNRIRRELYHSLYERERLSFCNLFIN